MAQMKMLQRMRILEEKGQQYATTQVKDLKVFGESADCSRLNLMGMRQIHKQSES